MKTKKLYLVQSDWIDFDKDETVKCVKITLTELDKLIEKFIRNHQQTKLTEDYSRAILKEFVRDYLLKKLEVLEQCQEGDDAGHA